jgi:hypothetical protein
MGAIDDAHEPVAYFSDCDRSFHFYVTDPGGMLERAKS